MDHAVITGTYADFKFVKTRKVCQIIIEIPSEQSAEALRILGGMPDPAAEQPVALALLDTSRSKFTAQTGAQRAVTRAIMLCKNEKFQEWVKARPLSQEIIDKHCQGHVSEEMWARAIILDICKISSRRDLAVDPDAFARFLDLETQFKYRDSRR